MLIITPHPMIHQHAKVYNELSICIWECFVSRR